MIINPKVVDVYHGDVVQDFKAAFQFGIRGIIHKATEGERETDPAYAGRRAKAVEAGFLWGAYHFMRPGDPVAQADHFFAAAYPTAETCLIVDHEDPKVSLADVIEFMRTVEGRIGRDVALYSGSLIKSQIVRSTAAQKIYLGRRRLWLAHYGAKPTWPHIWSSPWLWQFTGDGEGPGPHHIPGFAGNVDVSSFAGTADELAATWAGEPITSA